jgi:hypothetical protein
MTRKTSQTHRKAPLDRVRGDRGNDSPFSLQIGPPPRFYFRDNFPEMVAAARIVWDRCRETLMAEAAARPELPRPWAFFAFDRPLEETRPGKLRDRLIAEGRLTAREADGWNSYDTRRPTDPPTKAPRVSRRLPGRKVSNGVGNFLVRRPRKLPAETPPQTGDETDG